MALLTLKNRYPAEPFLGMFDGQEYAIADTMTVPEVIARHLKKQSIVRDNPITGDNDYRLAILEEGDNAEPLEALPVEGLDRSDMDSFRKVRIVPSGIRSTRPAERAPATFGAISKER